MLYDVIVIGGGIAGLYAAKRCCDQNKRVALLERDPTLGGRAKMTTFQGTKVVTGAGVGRKTKDVLLRALLKELHLDAPQFKVTHHASFPCAVKRMFLDVKRAYEDTHPRPVVTFKNFALQVLGPAQYANFALCAGYTDFEAADVADVLYDYGFEDNYSSWQALSVPWQDLIKTLQTHVQRHCTIYRRCAAHLLRYCRVSKQYAVYTDAGILYTRVVIVATAIDAIQTLLPKVALYKHIHGQSFLRLYANFATPLTLPSGVTIVRGPLQKMIPMSDTIVMVSYSDNANADYMSQFIENTKGNRLAVARMVEHALNLEDSSVHIESLGGFYFPIGTHYYDPITESRDAFIKAAQYPLPNVYVVGEVVSKHQGWTEGALESVETILGS